MWPKWLRKNPGLATFAEEGFLLRIFPGVFRRTSNLTVTLPRVRCPDNGESLFDSALQGEAAGEQAFNRLLGVGCKVGFEQLP